jgi:hypothetical protein
MELTELILRTYPWWEMQRVREMSLGAKAPGKMLSNRWRHAPGLVDHSYRGVTTPNCDTLYSGAWLDLAEGPVLIEAPASTLPYWSIAVMDLYTDNIAIMGSRYPGSGTLLVCGPDYRGPVPEGTAQVRSASQAGGPSTRPVGMWKRPLCIGHSMRSSSTKPSASRATPCVQMPSVT